MVKEVMKKIIVRFLDLYYREWWNIAICDIGEDLTPFNIRWITPTYDDRWFADPFIIEDNEEYYIVLVEEYVIEEHKGRLARLTISKSNFHIIKNETILDLPTHLSFPNYILSDGNLYVYPENSASGKLNYYKYDEQLTEGVTLVNLPLTDAVIYKSEKDYYILSTSKDYCNGNRCDIYKSGKPFEGYRLVDTIEFDDNTARGAGHIFEFKGKHIRPAQVCNNDYGEGVAFQELLINDGKVFLKEILRLYPQSKLYPDGFHTYNVYKDKVIIDGYKYRSKLLKKVANFMLLMKSSI